MNVFHRSDQGYTGGNALAILTSNGARGSGTCLGGIGAG